MNKLTSPYNAVMAVKKSNDELYHYGRSKLNGAPGPGSGRYPLGSGDDPRSEKEHHKEIHPDYARAHDRNTKVSEMSDAELNARLNRLNAEQRYMSLNPSLVNRGHDYVKYVIGGMTTLASLTGTALTLYSNSSKIQKLVDKMTGTG